MRDCLQSLMLKLLKINRKEQCSIIYNKMYTLSYLFLCALLRNLKKYSWPFDMTMIWPKNLITTKKSKKKRFEKFFESILSIPEPEIRIKPIENNLELYMDLLM